jgi:hypothetical protein
LQQLFFFSQPKIERYVHERIMTLTHGVYTILTVATLRSPRVREIKIENVTIVTSICPYVKHVSAQFQFLKIEMGRSIHTDRTGTRPVVRPLLH